MTEWRGSIFAISRLKQILMNSQEWSSLFLHYQTSFSIVSIEGNDYNTWDILSQEIFSWVGQHTHGLVRSSMFDSFRSPPSRYQIWENDSVKVEIYSRNSNAGLKSWLCRLEHLQDNNKNRKWVSEVGVNLANSSLNLGLKVYYCDQFSDGSAYMPPPSRSVPRLVNKIESSKYLRVRKSFLNWQEFYNLLG